METSVKFSVILPVYKNDSAEFFNLAIGSLYTQTLKADEIVIIKDGPLTKELDQVLKVWKGKMPEINVLPLEKNMGLSYALNAGIKEAKYEWLARMDSDDICRSNRFEKQLSLIESKPEIDILGSWIAEFDNDPNETKSVRKLPKTNAEIYKYAQWRCPFNHMTVMYKKSVIQAVGMYKTFEEDNTAGFGEDYELWARFLVGGYTAANIQEVLVDARTDQDFFAKRRRGLNYFRSEVKELNDLYKLGLINPFQYVIHFGMKAVVRFSPPFVVKFIYKGIRKTS